MLFFLAWTSSLAMAQTSNSEADPKAVVTSGNARFTVLTPQMIRMEWSADGKFEDRASLVFLNRALPVPPFNANSNGHWLIIKISALELRYKKNSGKFTADNLRRDHAMPRKISGMGAGHARYRKFEGHDSHSDDVNGATPWNPDCSRALAGRLLTIAHGCYLTARIGHGHISRRRANIRISTSWATDMITSSRLATL